MVDYSSWKVADLKAELKKREVPQTGLRVKQQFIDKLIELDSQTDQTEPTAAATDESAVPQQPSEDAVSQAPDAQPEQSQSEKPNDESASPKEEPLASDSAPTKAEDEKDERDESAQKHTETVSSVKVEHDTKPVEEPSTVDQTAQEHPQTAEEAPATATDQTLKTEDPAKPQENPASSSLQTSEANTAGSTPLPTAEALEDTRKRKRRSQSPAPTLEEIANRKARAEEAVPRVLLKDDKGYNDQKSTETTAESQNDSVPVEKRALSPKPAGKQDARFRGLFAPSDTPARPPSPQDSAMPDVDAGPAMHAATSSLYIDGLMRPLQPAALRQHLSSLAATPENTSDSEAIVEFYLDSIKTHCFVSFTSTVAASRVRSSIHGTVWPNERNRKNLRADFIPDDALKEWIQTEEQSRDRAGPTPRWEVRYETSDDGTTAVHAEVGSGSTSTGRRESGFNRTPPLGPRSDLERVHRRPSSPAPVPAPRPGQGFKPLDELFESTTTKPKLYYLPVPRPVADKRLDQFDDLIQKGVFPRRGGDEMRRITFEDEDQFVDAGPERMGPGPRAGGGRGRGRGRRGDSWR